MVAAALRPERDRVQDELAREEPDAGRRLTAGMLLHPTATATLPLDFTAARFAVHPPLYWVRIASE